MSSLLILTAFAVGMRHGLDWDHIAAIMDIASTQTDRRLGVFRSFLYAVGHGSVVATLASVALLVGFSLPEGIDTLMEKVVGITLVILGFYVFHALRSSGGDFRILPRWALIVNGALGFYDWAMAKATGTSIRHRKVLEGGYGNTSACLIGMVHGIGAETPTQVLLFALALGAGVAGGREVGIVLILAFVFGLIITNTVMAVLGTYGYGGASNRHRLFRTVAFATGSFSILLGVAFILGAGGYLPVLLVG